MSLPVSPDPLDGQLASIPLSPDVRCAIMNRMFNMKLNRDDYQDKANEFDAYFNHWYEEQCEGGARQVSVKKHSEILDCIDLLKEKTETRASVKSRIWPAPPIQSDPCHDTRIDGSI